MQNYAVVFIFRVIPKHTPVAWQRANLARLDDSSGNARLYIFLARASHRDI